MSRNRVYYHPRYSSVNNKLTMLNDGWWCYCDDIEGNLGMVEDCDSELVILYLDQQFNKVVFDLMLDCGKVPYCEDSNDEISKQL